MIDQAAARTDRRPRSVTGPLLLMLLVSSFSFAAIAKVAWATHFHTTCVPHGFVHGSDSNDGSFFARVESGCGSSTRRCGIYNYNSFVGDQTTGGSTMCNAWSQNYGSYTECASTAHTYYSGVFSDHVHKANNWCA